MPTNYGAVWRFRHTFVCQNKLNGTDRHVDRMDNKINVSQTFKNNHQGCKPGERPKKNWTVVSSKKTRKRNIYAKNNTVARSRCVYTSSASPVQLKKPKILLKYRILK